MAYGGIEENIGRRKYQMKPTAYSSGVINDARRSRRRGGGK